MCENKKKISTPQLKNAPEKRLRENNFTPKPIELVTILVRHEGIAAEILREVRNGKYKTRYFIYPQINGGIPFEVECDIPQRVPVEIAALLKPLIAAQNRRVIC